MRKVSLFAAPLMLAASIMPAFATMPMLTSKPNHPTTPACGRWAERQSGDAIYYVGIRRGGTTSREVAVARLIDSCLGKEIPDIVGFGSSAGFDERYCNAHRGAGICAHVEPASSAPWWQASSCSLSTGNAIGA